MVIENVWRYGRNIAFNAEAAMLAREIYEFDDGELDNGWVPTESDMYPKIWNSVIPMDAHLDCCMHLLFHGMIATIVEVMDKFMTHHKLTRKFE